MPDEINEIENTGSTDLKQAEHSKLAKLFEDAPQIARHAVALVLTLISIWIVHLTLSYLLGKEAKFFDRIPIRYVIDVADLTVLIKFIWHLIRDLRK